jgi:hypothetical protein
MTTKERCWRSFVRIICYRATTKLTLLVLFTTTTAVVSELFNKCSSEWYLPRYSVNCFGFYDFLYRWRVSVFAAFVYPFDLFQIKYDVELCNFYSFPEDTWGGMLIVTCRETNDVRFLNCNYVLFVRSTLFGDFDWSFAVHLNGST